VTGHFPRVTHCDFSQRKASSFNVRFDVTPKKRTSMQIYPIINLIYANHTAQLESVLCVLTLNVYYEKIFLFLWFWLLMVAIVCLSSTLYWAYIFLLPATNIDMVRVVDSGLLA